MGNHDSYSDISFFCPLPLLRQGVLRFAFIPAQLFSARASQNELEARAQISRCASGAGGRTCQSKAARRAGAAC